MTLQLIIVIIVIVIIAHDIATGHCHWVVV